jgi:hypothetical protein
VGTEGEDRLLGCLLYLGKAEDSLRDRLLSTHFRSGRTGHSTARRTFAALLDLESCPRPSRIAAPTPKQIERCITNYGLVPDDERRLTEWMIASLEVRSFASAWQPLNELERAAGAKLRPPFDQGRSPLWEPNPWRPYVAQRRRALRERARAALVP